MKIKLLYIAMLTFFAWPHTGGAVTNEDLQAFLQKYFNGYTEETVVENGEEKTVKVFMPQAIFDSIHPVGKGLRVKVHEVEIQWKHDVPTGKDNDVIGFGVRLTLYWEGPITKDGHTKLIMIYDAESERYTGMRVLETNGLTNEDAGSIIGAGIGAGIGAMIEGNKDN